MPVLLAESALPPAAAGCAGFFGGSLPAVGVIRRAGSGCEWRSNLFGGLRLGRLAARALRLGPGFGLNGRLLGGLLGGRLLRPTAPLRLRFFLDHRGFLACRSHLRGFVLGDGGGFGGFLDGLAATATATALRRLAFGGFLGASGDRHVLGVRPLGRFGNQLGFLADGFLAAFTAPAAAAAPATALLLAFGRFLVERFALAGLGLFRFAAFPSGWLLAILAIAAAAAAATPAALAATAFAGFVGGGVLFALVVFLLLIDLVVGEIGLFDLLFDDRFEPGGDGRARARAGYRPLWALILARRHD
jgi:hypothetical protein